MFIEVSSGLRIPNNLPVDDRYVFGTKDIALDQTNGIRFSRRYVGLKVTILNDADGKQRDYWFEGGITDAHFKPVPIGGGVVTGSEFFSLEDTAPNPVDVALWMPKVV